MEILVDFLSGLFLVFGLLLLLIILFSFILMIFFYFKKRVDYSFKSDLAFRVFVFCFCYPILTFILGLSAFAWVNIFILFH
ncbi:MAG: hypothetical protein SPI11_04925 [Campylobacter lanienae]|nr:hypothetical protein [Campylobacter lanienae]